MQIILIIHGFEYKYFHKKTTFRLFFSKFMDSLVSFKF